MDSYQLLGLDFQGKEYIARTNERTFNIHADELSKLLGGKRGLDLCSIVKALVKKHAPIINRDGEILNRLDLVKELQGSAHARKTKKTYRCACGAAIKKATVALVHPVLDVVVGCEDCTALDTTPKLIDPFTEDDPLRVVLDMAYESCLEHVKRTREALRACYPNDMFRMGVQPGSSLGQLVIIRPIEGLTGAQPAEDFHTLLGHLKRLHFGRYKTNDEGDKEWVECAPPTSIVTHMLAHKDPHVPVLSGIVRMPILTTSGEVLSDTGYDPKSKIYLAPEIKIDSIPDYVHETDVQEAKALLDHLFEDFPQAYPEAKSAVIGCFLDQCVRSTLVDGPTPAYCFEAPTGGEGSGKTIYANVIAYLSDGSSTASTVWTNNEEELAKQLLPLIESQRNVIMFDNVDGFVASPTLDSTLTSRVYETRRLGRNSVRDMVRVPFRSSVIFTSNGATFQNSLARRMVMVQLDPANRKTKVDKFGKRTYAVQHILDHVRNKENRARYVRAALVIAKGWLQAGSPKDPTHPILHSFEKWSDVIPSLVTYAGWPSMKRAIEAASTESNMDRQEAAQFVAAWWENFRDAEVRAMDLGMIAINGGFYLQRIKASSRSANPAYVGRSISQRFMGFVRKWPVTLEGGFVATVHDGPKRSGQPTWFLRVTSPYQALTQPISQDTVTEPKTADLESSEDSESSYGAFDPDGPDYPTES